MIIVIIPLDEVIYNENARNGIWCCLPYPGHRRGCPNYPKCIEKRKDFNEYSPLKWYAVVIEFDLKEHASIMRKRHPEWTEKQCRNLLYWQGRIRYQLKRMVNEFKNPNDIILDIPEACGINLFMTMKKHGLILKPRPDLVRKIMLVGRTKTLEDYAEE